MNVKRSLIVGATVIVVLALLYAAAWQQAHPRWHSMPESLTKPDPNIDRSHIPLGPYTVDLSGLIGGASENRVEFDVVFRPGDVHLQKLGEVGKELEGSVILHVGVRYLSNQVSAQAAPRSGPLVDGLRLHAATINTRPEFHIPSFEDATGQPIWIICSLFPVDLNLVKETHSFHGVSDGMCTATFRPRLHLHAFMGGIPPTMMPRMSVFLPNVYRLIAERIHGES